MGYIFFYENYDIYNTEQLCATLYKFMEMIFIARELGKTLVLPNFYFTPRNNELMNITNELEIDRIEMIDIRNILNIHKLKEIVNIILVTDFFKLKLNDFTLISKPNTELPFNNNKYYTIYGSLPVNKKEDIDFISLNIFRYLDLLRKYDNIIIHDYSRMGSPVWYKFYKGIYYWIRNHIQFNDFLKSKIIDINYDKTLMVHWRRGDFKVNINADENTKQYYKKYNEIGSLENLCKNIILRCIENKLDNVLLLTNETDEKELSKLTNVLENFNIKMYTISSSYDNNYLKYLINDISGIVNGSKCKYQLHGFGTYDRMSLYGKWILEENIDNNQIYFME